MFSQRETNIRGGHVYTEPWVYHGLTNTGTEQLIFVVVRCNSKGVTVPPCPANRPDEQGGKTKQRKATTGNRP